MRRHHSPASTRQKGGPRVRDLKARRASGVGRTCRRAVLDGRREQVGGGPVGLAAAAVERLGARAAGVAQLDVPRRAVARRHASTGGRLGCPVLAACARAHRPVRCMRGTLGSPMLRRGRCKPLAVRALPPLHHAPGAASLRAGTSGRRAAHRGGPGPERVVRGRRRSKGGRQGGGGMWAGYGAGAVRGRGRCGPAPRRARRPLYDPGVGHARVCALQRRRWRPLGWRARRSAADSQARSPGAGNPCPPRYAARAALPPPPPPCASGAGGGWLARSLTSRRAEPAAGE
eukprot:scaffold1137_cov280-Prasinococcus_capsulatus_cf.AAC.1